MLVAGVGGLPSDRVGERLLTCSRGAAASAIAEFVLGAMWAFEKRRPEIRLAEPPGQWNVADLGGRSGSRPGLVGTGAVGTEVVRRALMPLGPDDLVLCSGTLPRGVGFGERLKAASDAGFAAVSLWGRDVQAAREEGFADADLRAMLEHHGLVVAELDPAWWWLPGAADIHIPPEVDPLDVFRFGEAELFAMADALGARSVNAVDVFGGDWTIDAAAEAFAGLCTRAAEHGLLVHIEWLTWSRIPDLDTALEVVELAGAPNGGVNIDAWHLARSGAGPDDLGRLPGPRILAVQLDDGPRQPENDLVHATLHDRRLPGDGEFDLAALLGALRATGSAAPIGVEVFSDDLHALGAEEAARRAAASTRSLIERGGR